MEFRYRGCVSAKARSPASHVQLSTRSSIEKSRSSSQDSGFFQFFASELTRCYTLENDEARYTEKRQKVYSFIKIPRELEIFLFNGFLQCSDAFLFMFTFLPLRFAVAGWYFITTHCRRDGLLRAPEICDIVKVGVLLASCAVICLVDTSVMYHVVRGQAVIKLYIFYNMLEVADKLFSSFGQDILDALFWTATERKGRNRGHFGLFTHICLAVVYVIIHSLLILLQATTLNVAFNSHNKALLTIMMSNNFVELKGSVFKKFAKNNLFQMSCSDVRERFHSCILLLVVVIRNMAEFSWKLEHFWEMLPDLLLVVFGEFVVDWMKHAFITKFNEIPLEVYKDFTITISYDVAKSRQKNAFSDHSDQVSRRMGFVPLPLTVVLVKVITQTIRFDTASALALLALTYVALTTLKVLNSIVLLGLACTHIEVYEDVQRHAEVLKRLKRRSKSVPVSPCRLSLVEFSDVMQQTQLPCKGLTVSDVLTQAAELAAIQRSVLSISSVSTTLTPYPPLQSPQPPASPQKLASPQSGIYPPVTIRRKRSASCMEKVTATSRRQSEDQYSVPSRHDRLSGGAVVITSKSAVPSSPVSGSPDGVVFAQDVSATGGGLRLIRSRSIGELEKDKSLIDADEQTVAPSEKKVQRECESLVDVDRYTLCNNDRIES